MVVPLLWEDKLDNSYNQHLHLDQKIKHRVFANTFSKIGYGLYLLTRTTKWTHPLKS